MRFKTHILKAAAIAAALCLAVAGSASANDVLEGPKSVTEELKPGDGLISPQFRSQFFKDTFAPWFEFRDMLKEDYHLNLGFDYTVIGQASTSDLGAGHAIGHDLRFYGTWMPVRPGGPNSGSLVFKGESREAYTRIAPQDLGFDSGAVSITAAQFSAAGWVLTNFYWKQRLFGDRVTVGFGQVDVTDYVDVYSLANPVWGFQNLVFSVSPALAAPNQRIGAAAGAWLSGHVYTIAGIADTNGDPASPNFDVFKDWETFQHFEIGYSSSKERQFLDNLHVTLWHSDKREAAGVPEDWGVSVSYSWLFRNTWAPFLRAGWADGGAALYRASVSTGFGYLTRQQDLFGLAVNWSRPGGGQDLNDQWTAEVFYK
jgi:porin